MIYDRDYMRSEPDQRESRPLRTLLAVIVAAFVIQAVIESFSSDGGRYFYSHVALSLSALKSWRIWTLLTTGLLQPQPVGPLALLLTVLNTVFMYFLGRKLLPMMGGRRFIAMFATAIGVGGLVTTGVAALRGLPGVALGCTGALFAMTSYFACARPNESMSVLVMFFIPITAKAKHLVLAATGITAFYFIVSECQGSVGQVPPSSLLGGLFTGWLFHALFSRRRLAPSPARPFVEAPVWMKKKKTVVQAKPSFTVNLSEPQDLRTEVDRILDKINSQGFGSLNEDERRVLDGARDLLNKR